jgi:transcriptional regulator with XRE-family HTH domain
MNAVRPLHEVLVELRRRANLSQEEVAERAGVSPRTIGALERGERSAPQRETLRRLAAALGADPAELRPASEPVAHRRPAPVPDTGSTARSPLAAHASEAVAAALHVGGRLDAALAEYETVRRMFRALGDADGCARAYAALADIHIQRGRCDLALTEVLGAPCPPAVTDATRARLALVRARAFELGGELRDALGAATGAVEAAGLAGEDQLLAHAEIRYASVCTQLGELDRARTSFLRAARLAEEASDELGLIQADIGLGIVLLRRGPVTRARFHAERALANAERRGDVVRARAAAVHAGSAAREAGDPAVAARIARAAAFPEIGEESVQSHHARFLLALLALDDGAAARARALLEPLVDPVRSSTDEQTRRETSLLLVAVDLAQGRTGEAARGLAAQRTSGDLTKLVVPDACDVAVRCLLRSGEPVQAERLATEFVETATGSGSTLHLVEALRSRAAAREARGDIAGAARDAGEAGELARSGGFVLRHRLLTAALR